MAALTRSSRFASRTLEAAPELATALVAEIPRPWTPVEMASMLDQYGISDEAQLYTALRRLRKHVILRLMARDLGGLAGLAEVMTTMTALAETTVRCALEHLGRWQAEQYGQPVSAQSGNLQDLIVVGMGKLGGGELNVSSDIDLIFVYGEEGETTGPRSISNHEYFTLLGRKLIGALNEITPDGYVFRVDMRLRPYGDSGPLVSSLAMLEEYFYTQGREWERYAWIKGRPLTGSRHDELDQLVRPFVFRKYLDFGAFASMRSLHTQIRAEVQRRDMQNNIKLGPGGIREIEFTAQVFQLIRGGKIADLRIKPTVAVLFKLEERGLLPQSTVAELHAAYLFLRNLEHRLQYLDDAQTQMLPKNPEDQAIIARTMGFADYGSMLEALDLHRTRVTRHFEQVFSAPQSTQESHPLAGLWHGTMADQDAIEKLMQSGFSSAEDVWHRLSQMKRSGRYQQLPASNRARLDALMPPLIEVSGGFPNPDQTLERILLLLERIGRRESYLALLLEYPLTLNQVARICSASAWAAEYLSHHPVLLDELLDTRLLYAKPDWAKLRAEARKLLTEAEGDVERQMDTLRNFKHAQVFHLLTQDLAQLLPLETLSDHLSALADLILGEVLQLCWAALSRRHRDTPLFAIVAYGKLGGKELGYASDLDIIFLYDDEAPEAAEIYARLAQRINTWLTSITPAGVLYETDLRLRPNGAAGLLVSSVSAFEDYQHNHAWVWEHQALTRARWVCGDESIGHAFGKIRNAVICRERDHGALRNEVTAMRQKMLDAHPNTSGLFDIKHDQGGIIDVEFIVQYLVLAHAHEHPELVANIGNLALLKLSAEKGLIPSTLAEQTRDSYREYRRQQHQLRLQGAKYARTTMEVAEPLRIPVRTLWQLLFETPA
jgi:glutamate-ammonia-ligase adenylyltransferase